MSKRNCKYCDDELYNDWLSSIEGEFCSHTCALLWKQNKTIVDLHRRIAELEQALKKISNPVFALQNEASARGDALNGSVAIQLSNDPEFLKDIARKALNSTTGTT